MPTSIERRAAPRVRCALPLRLHSQGRLLTAQAHDLSRYGVGLQLPVSQLGLQPSAGVEAVAHAIEGLFAETLAAEFRYDVLGPLVRRALRAVRIGRFDAHSGVVEIGCVLRSALTDAEIAVLGVDVPPAERECIPAAAAAAQDEPPSAEPWSAYLTAAPDRLAPPLHARTAGLDATTECFRLEFGDARRLPIDSLRNEAGHLLSALVRTYGTEPMLLLLQGEAALWGGPAQVCGVELQGGESSTLCLSLRPSRQLTPGDQVRLGLLN